MVGVITSVVCAAVNRAWRSCVIDVFVSEETSELVGSMFTKLESRGIALSRLSYFLLFPRDSSAVSDVT